MWNEDAKEFLHGCGKTPSCLKFTGSFWITSIFTLPLLILMIGMMAGFVSHTVSRWGTFLATTPIMLVAGVPFYQECLGLI